MLQSNAAYDNASLQALLTDARPILQAAKTAADSTAGGQATGLEALESSIVALGEYLALKA